jgi:short-subunit dehydrogenase
VLITGAGSGIGRELAVQLVAEGARVAAVDRQREGLEKLSVELHGRPIGTALADVTDLAALRAAVRELEGRLGPTELLIANAGIGMETSALDFRAEDVSRQIEINLLGVVNSIDVVLPGMRERGRGHLAAISSLASFRGLPRMGGYCASKAGLNALLDALRIELGPLGIAVSTLCPGWVRTGLTADLPIPSWEVLPAEVAARRILWALRRRKAFHAFSATGAWRVRLLRLLPTSLADWLTRRMMVRYARLTGISLDRPLGMPGTGQE